MPMNCCLRVNAVSIAHSLLRGFGDAEVGDSRRSRQAFSPSVHKGYLMFVIAMDDALLVRVLDRVTNLHEKLDALMDGKFFAGEQ